jgi:hydroxymethylbilane synthase
VTLGLLRVATRGSRLARWQAQHVGALLQAAHGSIGVELVVVSTTGDVRSEEPLHGFGGQGVFVKEVQEAVLEGRADLAVHSAKDLPSQTPPGLCLAAVPERGDPHDVLVGAGLGGLAVGATVATGSVRRRAQLAARRPDLHFVDLRGNIETRLDKVPDGGSIVLAAIALERLGLSDRVAEVLPADLMLPQAGQGALAVECRAGDGAAAALLAAIEHPPSRMAVDAERAFLAALGAGCTLPVAAFASVHPGGHVSMRGLVASPDGREIVRHHASGDDPVALGRHIAERVLDEGGRDLLSALLTERR